MPQITLKIRARLKNLPQNPKFKRLSVRLHAYLVLPISLAVGLVPPLGLAVAGTLWQNLPLPTADARPLIFAALLLSPFAAGFVHCRRVPTAGNMTGGTPAFILWLAAALLYTTQMGAPSTQTVLISLIATVLTGVAGGMTAVRLGSRKISGKNKKAEA